MKATIQKELQTMSIAEVCKNHNLTLLELMNIFKSKKEYTLSKRGFEDMNIYYGNSYRIQKTINGKSVSFGSYSTIEDARKVRDKLVEFDWDKDYLPLICRQLGVERTKQRGGVKECM